MTLSLWFQLKLQFQFCPGLGSLRDPWSLRAFSPVKISAGPSLAIRASRFFATHSCWTQQALAALVIGPIGSLLSFSEKLNLCSFQHTRNYRRSAHQTCLHARIDDPGFSGLILPSCHTTPTNTKWMPYLPLFDSKYIAEPLRLPPCYAPKLVSNYAHCHHCHHCAPRTSRWWGRWDPWDHGCRYRCGKPRRRLRGSWGWTLPDPTPSCRDTTMCDHVRSVSCSWRIFTWDSSARSNARFSHLFSIQTIQMATLAYPNWHKLKIKELGHFRLRFWMKGLCKQSAEIAGDR